jgi:hypothetical protein
MESIVFPVVALNMIGIGVVAAIALGTKQPRGLKQRYVGIDSYDVEGDPVETQTQMPYDDIIQTPPPDMPSAVSTMRVPPTKPTSATAMTNTFPGAPTTPATDSSLDHVYVVVRPGDDKTCVVRASDKPMSAQVKRAITTAADGAVTLAEPALTLAVLTGPDRTRSATILQDIGKQLKNISCADSQTAWLHDWTQPGVEARTPMGNVRLRIGLRPAALVLQVREDDFTSPIGTRIAYSGMKHLLDIKSKSSTTEDGTYAFECDWAQPALALGMVNLLADVANSELIHLTCTGTEKTLNVVSYGPMVENDRSLQLAMVTMRNLAAKAGVSDAPDFVVFKKHGSRCTVDDARAKRMHVIGDETIRFDAKKYDGLECAHEVHSPLLKDAVKLESKYWVAFKSEDAGQWSCIVFTHSGPPPRAPAAGRGDPGGRGSGRGDPGGRGRGRGRGRGTPTATPP